MIKSKYANKRILALFVLLLILIFSLGFSVLLSNAEDISYDFSENIQEEYARGTLFSVPSCTIKKGNNKFSTNFVLKYPDNRESSYSTNLLDKEGIYTIVYSYNENGENKSFEKEFSVYTSITSFFSSKQAEFSVNSKLNSKINANKEYVGVGVTSKKVGTEVVYSKEIDISDNTKDNTLLEFIANPSTLNILEITNFTIMLTDVNNVDNWVKIYVKQLDYETNSYLLWAGANFTYGFAGYDPYNAIGLNRGNTYSGNGGITAGYVASNSTYTANSFGVSDSKTISSIKLSYDNQEKRIYCYPGLSNTYVADLDDTSDVGAGNEWGGFSSNKVWLSISTNLYSSSLNYIILNVDGLDMSNYKVNDTVAPTIDIDLGGNTEIPFGIVNKPYKIFDTKVFDNIDVSLSKPIVTVISDTGKVYDVKNNSFTPKTAGKYKMYYTLSDFAGNENVKTVEINVLSEYGENELQFLDTSFDDINLKVGEKFSVQIQETTGGSGKINHVWCIKDNDNVIASDFDVYSFNKTGDFILEYTAYDYNDTKITKRYNVKVTQNLYPVFDMPYLADNYILGKNYYLPKVDAFDYSKNLDGEKIDVKVKVGDSVKKGETLGIIGPSGGGKTTLLSD